MSYIVWYRLQNAIFILEVGCDMNFRENAISLADKLRSPEDHVWCWWFNRKNGTLLSDKKIEMRTFVLIAYFFVACFLTHQQLIHEVSLTLADGYFKCCITGYSGVLFVLLELFVFDDFMCYDVHLMTMIMCIFSSN